MSERTHLSINASVFKRSAERYLVDPDANRREKALAGAVLNLADKYDELRAFFGVKPGEWFKWDEGAAAPTRVEKNSTPNPYLRSEIEDALTCLRNGADTHHVAYHLEGALAALATEEKP